MTIFSKPKLTDNGTKILFPQNFEWIWVDENQAVSSYDDIIDLWRLGQLRGAATAVAVTVVLAAAGVGIYKIVKAKKSE